MPVEEGEFIAIPAWHVEGMVLAVKPDDSGLGTDNAISVLIEERPDDPNPRRYRLEPGEYRVI